MQNTQYEIFQKLFQKKEKSESLKKPINKVNLKMERLFELNETLCDYAGRIHEKWINAKTKSEKDSLIKISFDLNHFLYELDIDIQSGFYTDELIKKCEDLENQLKNLF